VAGIDETDGAGTLVELGIERGHKHIDGIFAAQGPGTRRQMS